MVWDSSHTSPTPGLWDATKLNYAETWYVDGIDIQSMAFGVEKFDISVPEMRGEHTTIPSMNGVLPRFNRTYDPGSIGFKMWVLGCMPNGEIPQSFTERRKMFERNLGMILRVFGYQGNVITIQRTYVGAWSDAEPTTATARAVVSGITSLDTMMSRQRGEIVVTLNLIDSFWADATPTTDATPANSDTSRTLRLSNLGTAPIDDAVLSVVGPITAPKISCPSSGSWVQYKGAVPAGQTLTIDSSTATATLNGASVIANISHGGTAKFMVIPPRESGMFTETSYQTALTLSGTNTGSTTALSVTYRRKHMVMV